MYRKLAHWLRMLGYNTIYEKNMSDDDLLTIAKEEDRILITRDELLLATARKKGIEAYLIKGTTIEKRLQNLAKKIPITLELPKKHLPRCTICNSEIQPIDKELISNTIPEGTKKHYDIFWQCTNPTCKKIYWKGSHWEKMKKTLKKSREAL